MKTLLLGIGLLFAFQSIAQATMKNGEVFQFNGTYTYTDLDGEYSLELYGQGDHEGDLTFKGSEESYKMSIVGEFDDNKTLTISIIKVWEGTCAKEATYKADKILFSLVIDGNACKTKVGSLSMGGFEKGFSEIMLIKN